MRLSVIAGTFILYATTISVPQGFASAPDSDFESGSVPEFSVQVTSDGRVIDSWEKAAEEFQVDLTGLLDKLESQVEMVAYKDAKNTITEIRKLFWKFDGLQTPASVSQHTRASMFAKLMDQVTQRGSKHLNRYFEQNPEAETGLENAFHHPQHYKRLVEQMKHHDPMLRYHDRLANELSSTYSAGIGNLLALALIGSTATLIGDVYYGGKVEAYEAFAVSVMAWAAIYLHGGKPHWYKFVPRLASRVGHEASLEFVSRGQIDVRSRGGAHFEEEVIGEFRRILRTYTSHLTNGEKPGAKDAKGALRSFAAGTLGKARSPDMHFHTLRRFSDVLLEEVEHYEKFEPGVAGKINEFHLDLWDQASKRPRFWDPAPHRKNLFLVNVAAGLYWAATGAIQTSIEYMQNPSYAGIMETRNYVLVIPLISMVAYRFFLRKRPDTKDIPGLFHRGRDRYRSKLTGCAGGFFSR